MSGSRWADDAADKEAKRKEKEQKKAAKLLKQQRQDEEAQRIKAQTERAQEPGNNENDRPLKKRRLSQDVSTTEEPRELSKLMRFPTIGWGPSRHIDNFERLNHIEEGSYGWVSRAKDISSGQVVALKKLKIDKSGNGFPDTALREIQLLQMARHKHIVELREVVVGDAPNDVYLVMDFLEHDLKILQEEMTEPFMPSEIKTVLLQIISGVGYLHENWILHRDLKTSNILLNNRGEIKLADFGMARQFSDPPPPNLTQLVVTRWYRAPELLLGTKTYGPAVDMWSVGCVFGELVRKEPLLQGRNEADQLTKIFSLVGVPNEDEWPGFRRLPNAKALKLPSNSPSIRAVKNAVRAQFPLLTSAGVDLLLALLTLNPAQRMTADEALGHPFFSEAPRPKPTAMFPTFPSKAGGERRRRVATPNAPQRGEAPRINADELNNLFSRMDKEEVGGGFALKLA